MKQAVTIGHPSKCISVVNGDPMKTGVDCETCVIFHWPESKSFREGEDWASDRKSAKNEAEARARKLSRASMAGAGKNGTRANQR